MGDEINAYAKGFKNGVLESINGVPIHELDDVLPTWWQVQEEFYEFRFAGHKRPLMMKVADARARQNVILGKYQIPAEARLED